MRLAVLALALAASGCALSPPLGADDVTVAGPVVAVETENPSYLPRAVVWLSTEDGDERIVVPARADRCLARGLDAFLDVRPPHRFIVTGERLADGSIEPCGSKAHAVLAVIPMLPSRTPRRPVPISPPRVPRSL